MRKLNIAGVIIFFTMMTGVVLCQDVFVPIFDPVYDDLNALIDRGYLNDMRVSEKPWMISEVVSSIVRDRQRFDAESAELASSILSRLKPAQEEISRRLFADFNLGIELRGLSRGDKQGYNIVRDRYVSRDFKNEYGSVYKARWWISREGKWGIDTRLIFDTDGTRYPWYYGAAHNGRTIGQFDHAYGYLNAGYFKFMAGRNRMSWGI